MAIIMDGKALAEKLKNEIRAEVKNLTVKPGLAVIIVGSDPASKIYVNGKIKDCLQCGIESFEFALPETTTQDEILQLIRELNSRHDIHGIICQLPLPKGLDPHIITQAILPQKDVDCFHYENLGRTVSGNYGFLPCTPSGVMELLRHYNIELKGKQAVVINRSNIVGKPQAMLLINAHATVTICHSLTQNLSKITSEADILITAVGKKNFITKNMVKTGSVVIDVALVHGSDGKLYGDVDFESVCDVVSHITPVPGGVGPMTRAMLMRNTLISAKSYLYNNIIKL